MVQTGFCEKTGKDIELEVTVFARKSMEVLECPECGEKVFDMGGTLYHGS